MAVPPTLLCELHCQPHTHTHTAGNHNNNAGKLEILEVWVAESGVWPQILLRLHRLSDRDWGGAQDGKVRTVEPLATFMCPNTSTHKRNTKDRIKVCLKPQYRGSSTAPGIPVSRHSARQIKNPQHMRRCKIHSTKPTANGDIATPQNHPAGRMTWILGLLGFALWLTN